MRALIIKEPWASKIVSGEKTIELRTRRTKKIGQEIYIAKAGTKTLIGRVTIEKCVRLTLEDYMNLEDKHLVGYGSVYFTDEKLYGWYLINPVRFDKPIAYEHPRGAQIWVVIPDK